MLPISFRRILYRLSFEVEAQRSVRELSELLLDGILKWHIDQTAIAYQGGINQKHRLMDYHTFFTECIRPGEYVLDIGCGNGALSYYSMAQMGVLVTGIDMDETNIRQARERYQHENLGFILGDVRKGLPEGNFDVIVMSNVLEHIENRLGLLKTLRDKYQPKLWLIRVPMINRDWLVPLKKEFCLSYLSDSTHYTEYTLESFKDEMVEEGLEVRHTEVAWGEIWAEVHYFNWCKKGIEELRD